MKLVSSLPNREFPAVLILAYTSVWICIQLAAATRPDKGKSNIVFILTDDQDVAVFGKYPMNKTKHLIADEGITFNNMYVVSPLCCPSRASILTGKYVHNHGCLNNSLSGGCSSPDWQNLWEDRTFPVHLKKSGYNTFFAGKYLNAYGSKKAGGVKHVPLGWDEWNGLVGNSKYYNYVLSVNGRREKHGHHYKKDYLTKIIHERAVKFIKKQSDDTPFFLMLSTPSCHAPYTPAPQYKHKFAGVNATRTPHWNVHGKDKHWLVEQCKTPMREDDIEYLDNQFRNRWRTLLSVDDMIEDVYHTLKDKDLLDNTYIFFTSDNGYHLGQYSMIYGKRQLYDFDIKVPFMVRGPGVPKGIQSYEPLKNIDLPATFVDIAGGKADDFDGMSFTDILTQTPSASSLSFSPSSSSSSSSSTRELHNSKETPVHFHVEKNGSEDPDSDVINGEHRQLVLIEHYGERARNVPGCPQYHDQWMFDCGRHCQCADSWNNTYICVIYHNSTDSYKYCLLDDWVDFKEVYDVGRDPYEFNNVVKTIDPDLLDFMNEELQLLSTCDGKSCHIRQGKRPLFPLHR